MYVCMLQKITLSNLNEERRERKKIHNQKRSLYSALCLHLSLQLKGMIIADCPSSGGLTTAVTLTKSEDCQWNPGVNLKQLCCPNLIPFLLLLLCWKAPCQKRQWLHTGPVTTLLPIINMLIKNNDFSNFLLMLFSLLHEMPHLYKICLKTNAV